VFHVKQSTHNKGFFKVVVVGGGHAGVEAALSSATLGCSVALITTNSGSIARMSCNPAIGGIAKGHLVREIDALGGYMGVATDAAGVQFKTLNKSKGLAVRALRVQTDKRAYERVVRNRVSSESNISVIEGEVDSVLVGGGLIRGIRLITGETITSDSVVLTCGTFLNGVIHIGKKRYSAGRMGEDAAGGLTASLKNIGFRVGRLKTGTPPRLKRSTINFSALSKMFGDDPPTQLSLRTKNFSPPNRTSWAANTNKTTHELIGNNIHNSPMYSGQISAIGPRYCPSIEDKITRFSGKSSHRIILEEEWCNSKQIYAGGFSTSLPADIQIKALKTMKGLESVELFRPGYAIEYDFVPPSQLKSSLETKLVDGLFFSGQINGTSGYEEAAAQGLLAGINAAHFVLGRSPFILGRDQAYIGVLIDDLITKDVDEPYRIFTSRAEHRLSLRSTNADRRLSHFGRSLGLLPDDVYSKVCRRQKHLDCLLNYEDYFLNNNNSFKKNLFINFLLSSSTTSSDLLKNDELVLPENLSCHENYLIINELEAMVKYAPYIRRHERSLSRILKNDNLLIPMDFQYSSCVALSTEAREKLNLVKPETLGQASRVSGVTPSDIAALSVILHVG